MYTFAGGGTNLPITGSDSGFDSSSHQTLMTSGRLSALSHHSDASTLNIVIPDGQSDYSIEHERPLTHVRKLFIVISGIHVCTCTKYM